MSLIKGAGAGLGGGASGPHLTVEWADMDSAAVDTSNSPSISAVSSAKSSKDTTSLTGGGGGSGPSGPSNLTSTPLALASEGGGGSSGRRSSFSDLGLGGGIGGVAEGGDVPSAGAHSSEGVDLYREMDDLATLALCETGVFCSNTTYLNRVSVFRPEQIRAAQARGYMEQSGVLRINCIDCLDRTNKGQRIVGLKFLSLSLQALGVAGKDDEPLGASSPLLAQLMAMFDELGDRISIQYGGSEAHKKGGIAASGTKNAKSSRLAKSGELLTSIKRYYSNAFTDNTKQDAMNVFLGRYVPSETNPLWELDSDYDLHNRSLRPTEPLVDHVLFQEMLRDLKVILATDEEEEGALKNAQIGGGDASSFTSISATKASNTQYDDYDAALRPPPLDLPGALNRYLVRPFHANDREKDKRPSSPTQNSVPIVSFAVPLATSSSSNSSLLAATSLAKASSSSPTMLSSASSSSTYPVASAVTSATSSLMLANASLMLANASDAFAGGGGATAVTVARVRVSRPLASVPLSIARSERRKFAGKLMRTRVQEVIRE